MLGIFVLIAVIALIWKGGMALSRKAEAAGQNPNASDVLAGTAKPPVWMLWINLVWWTMILLGSLLMLVFGFSLMVSN